jgi:site-specific recombinase XerD
VPTYNLHLQGIRELFKQAVDDRFVANNPVDGIKQKKLAKPIRHTAKMSEFKAIVKSIRDQKLSDTADESADYIEFLGLAGLGQAEASSLTWGDVNMEASQIPLSVTRLGRAFLSRSTPNSGP